MKRSVALTFVSALLLASCKKGNVSEIFSSDDEAEEDSVEAFVGDTLHLFEEEAPPVAVDELFDDFFFNFASDSRFQKQRIRFPLACKDGAEVMKVSRQEWTQFNKFDTQDIFSVIYEKEQDMDLQKDTALTRVVVEWMYLEDEYVEKYNFKRLDGVWILMDMNKELIENVPNGDFLKFYSKFAADSVYQREAISTPLKLVLTPQSEEEDEQVEELSIDQWFEMRTDLPLPKDALVNIDYGQSSSNPNSKTLLLEGVSNGFFMKFKFHKYGENWKLTEVEY